MHIIEILPLDDGAHRNQNSNNIINRIPDGWAIIPDSITIPDTFPFVNIEVEGNYVISMTAGIVPEITPEEPEVVVPSEVDLLKEQVNQDSEVIDELLLHTLES